MVNQYRFFLSTFLQKKSFSDHIAKSFFLFNLAMFPQPSFETIKINQIRISDEWNIRPFLSSQLLPRVRASIKTFGLLHPPIVHKISKNQYQLIAGHIRLAIFREIFVDKKYVTALVLNNKNISKNILSYILEDQLLSGAISPMEKACFFHIALKHTTIDEAAALFSPILYQKLQPHSINKMLLLLDLEPELKIDVHNGIVGEKLALELLLLSTEDRLTLHAIFKKLELGGGKQKRLLTLSKDVARGQGKTIRQLLHEADSQEILMHPEMNHPQKISNLFSMLHKKLFPQSNAAEEQFLINVSRMELPPSCSISHSQSFEKDEVSVVLNFNDLSAVEQRLTAIKQLLEN